VRPPLTNIYLSKETSMNYEDCDTYDMCKRTTHSGIKLVRRGPAPHLMGAKTLVDNDVYGQKGDKLGELTEIMLDMRSGKVGYAVLSFDAMLGMGERLFAVPWKTLILDTKNKVFALNVEKVRLKDAPGFEKDNWPDMADQNWAKQIHWYYRNECFRNIRAT